MSHSYLLTLPAQALLRALSQNAPTYITRTLSQHRIHVAKQSTNTHIRHVMSMRPPNHGSSILDKTTVDQFPDLTLDNAIVARYVRIIMPEGGLSPRESLISAMSRVRQGTEHLVQRSKVDEDGMVICRIMTIADLLQQKEAKERTLKEQRRSSKQNVPKKIEINWAIGSNDLEHKLTQLKRFIQDGKKVEVVLANKRRQRRATPEEGRELLSKIRMKLAEADAEEIKEIQGGDVGQITILTIRKRGSE